MYEQFGALVVDKMASFSVFFPDSGLDPGQYKRGGPPRIKSIRVLGDFQSKIGGKDWDFVSAPVMNRTAYPSEQPKGWLYSCDLKSELPDGYYQYKYFVEFENQTTRWCSDPCTKYGGSDANENAAFVVGGNTTTVVPIVRRIPPKDLIIYELMLDDFTKEFQDPAKLRAPVDILFDRLDYLEKLGVNAVEFMPLTAWRGTDFSWGYNPVHFFSVEYRYINDPAAPADKLYRLKCLFNEMHQRGISIILDGVFNHVDAGSDPNRGFPYRWLYQDPADSPFIGSYSGGGYFEDFDYYNACTEEFIQDVCGYWFDKFQIDGMRFDYSLGFYIEGESETGISKLISDIKKRLAAGNKSNVALFLEHLTDNRYDAIDDTNKICASGCWFDPFMFKSFDYARNANIDSEMLRILNSNMDFAGEKVPVTYVENHDHSTIVNVAGGRGRWFKAQPAAIALLTSPGAVMIHNGQEYGEDYYLPEGGPERVQSRPLRWKQYGPESGDFAGMTLFSLYQKLIEIREQHPALRSPNFFPFPVNHPDGYGAFLESDVVIYHRWGYANDGGMERFIIVINYSDTDQWVTIPFSSNGRWEDLLNGGFIVVDSYRVSNQRINSNWARLYYQRA